MYQKEVLRIRCRCNKTPSSTFQNLMRLLRLWMVSHEEVKDPALTHLPHTWEVSFNPFRLVFSGTVAATSLVSATAN